MWMVWDSQAHNLSFEALSSVQPLFCRICCSCSSSWHSGAATFQRTAESGLEIEHWTRKWKDQGPRHQGSISSKSGASGATQLSGDSTAWGDWVAETPNKSRADIFHVQEPDLVVLQSVDISFVAACWPSCKSEMKRLHSPSTDLRNQQQSSLTFSSSQPANVW